MTTRGIDEAGAADEGSASERIIDESRALRDATGQILAEFRAERPVPMGDDTKVRLIRRIATDGAHTTHRPETLALFKRVLAALEAPQ